MRFYNGLLNSNVFAVVIIRHFLGLSFLCLLPSYVVASALNSTNSIKPNQDIAVIIKGINGDLLKNSTARLPTFVPDCRASFAAIVKYKRTIRIKLGKALRALGYYHAKKEIKAIQNQGCWRIMVNILAGEPVRISEQTVTITGVGRHEAAFQQLIKKTPYPTNAIFNHQTYTAYKKSLLEKAQELGYLKARFDKKQVEVNKTTRTANVMLSFNTAERFKYGAIRIKQDVLADDVMGKFIILKAGDRFSSTTLIRQQQLLQNSGYYNVVTVRPNFKAMSNRVIPIDIQLTPRRRTGYLGRIGYGTDTGLRAKATMERRWTGSSGKRLLINAGLSQRINEINLQLTHPRNDPENNSLFYTIGFKQDSNDDVDSESLKFGVLSTSIRSNEWKRTLSLNYLRDRTDVDGAATSATRSNLMLMGIKYAHVKADNRLFPERGWRLSFEAEGAVEELFSDVSLLQLQAHGKYIHKVGKGRFITRLDVGTTFGDSLDDLPKELRFFAGGNNSIRGFSYESLGERNIDNKVIGGKQLIETSFEYEHPLVEKWSMAGFVDAGNAFDEFDIDDVEVGFGFGFRWRSPIGPIRIDLAQPVDNLSDVHLHLSIGPDL